MVKNMKNAFLILTITMSLAHAAAESGSTSMPANGEKYCNTEKVKEEGKWQSTQGRSVAMPGSENLNSCDSMARGFYKTIYSNGNRKLFDWTTYIRSACADNCDTKENFDGCINEKKKFVKSCESVAYVMSHYDRDWNDEEQITPVQATAIGGAGQQPNGSATQAAAATSSSAIKCKSEGIETLDYIACKKFATQLDLIDAVQTVAQGAQELVYADKMMDSQTKFAKEENTATGALKATGESLEMQQNMYQQRTAVDATKLAYLYSIYNEMPKSAEIVGKCDKITNITPVGIDKISPDECKEAVRTGQGGFALAQNQSQIDAMRSRLITIATSAGSNIILANLLGKRAKDVKNAIADIDSFVPTDPTIMTEEDALSTYCKLNPTVQKCLGTDLSRTFDALNDNIITFGEGGTGTSYGSNNGISTNAMTDSNSDGTKRTSVTPVGSIIAGAAKDNSIEGSSGATVSTGKGPSGGGGGGGFGGGSGGGGGGGAPTAPAQGGVSAAVQGKTPTYGGGAGSISVVGGLGLNRAKGDGKAEDNPFGKLFGKDTPKGSGVVNFRDIASQKVGAKGDNLFDMISKRYSNVAADKRLLEYELTK
jgi:uncharacterized membrane protein YgcG